MKKRLFKFPETIAFFPVGPEEEGEHAHPRKMKGIALIIAVMIISIMMMFASDFIVSATVDLTLATSHRDNIKAEYVAKSGANWAIWLNLFDYGIDLQLSSSKDPAMAQAKSAIGPLWNKLNDVFSYDAPLDLSQTATFVQAFGMSGFMDSAVIDMLQSLGGELGIGVLDEGGKINLNVCYQNRTVCKTVMMMLDALMNCTEVEKDYVRTKNLKTQEIVAHIQDWIDADASPEPASGQSSEDDTYRKRVPPHKAKNAPMDTIDELRIVEGWTDELHAYFSPYLTVYPFTHSQDKDKSAFKININAMDQEVLKCFFSRELSSPDAKEAFVKKLHELLEKNGQIAATDSELKSVLKDIIGYSVDPAEKDKEGDKGSWLTTSSRAYRIRGKGIVGNQTKTVEYILERQAIAQRKAGVPGQPPWRLNGFTMR